MATVSNVLRLENQTFDVKVGGEIVHGRIGSGTELMFPRGSLAITVTPDDDDPFSQTLVYDPGSGRYYLLQALPGESGELFNADGLVRAIFVMLGIQTTSFTPTLDISDREYPCALREGMNSWGILRLFWMSSRTEVTSPLTLDEIDAAHRREDTLLLKMAPGTKGVSLPAYRTPETRPFLDAPAFIVWGPDSVPFGLMVDGGEFHSHLGYSELLVTPRWLGWLPELCRRLHASLMES